jgi:LAO/AO transport system kinase
LKIEELFKLITKGDRTALARGITLFESSLLEDWQKSKELLKKIPQSKTQSMRLGFSGPPGVGKSSLIEKVGLEFIKRGKTVAVLAIDPSSEITGGSILGDKTRMEELSRSPKAFIRPSASRGHLGGVTASLPAVILLCEQAGYDIIMIESVGVGQSEIELSKMVDCFTLISQAGGGDELQGIKKGILEYVDFLLINKADRDLSLANIAKQQYLSAFKILSGKNVKIEMCSALNGMGISTIVDLYFDFYKSYNYEERNQFEILWFESLLASEFKKKLKNNPKLIKQIENLELQIKNKSKNVIEAIDLFFDGLAI